MRRSKTSRMIAIFMAVVMALTMTSTVAFGAEGDPASTDDQQTKNLLVFGASTSSGYGLSNFWNKNRGFAVDNNDLNAWTYDIAEENYSNYNKYGRQIGYFPKGRISEDSYPWKLKNYIADTEFDEDLSKVNLSPLTLNGMRTNELRGLLDPEYAVEAFNLENQIVPTGKGF